MVPTHIPGIRHVLAVASGKGGVGKSMVAVNIAASLAQEGMKVGILDGDIYGPSLPKMLGIKEQPESHNQRILPIYRFNMACMSIGLLIPENSPLIWRGPMIQKALYKLLFDVVWNHKSDLDVLIVDLPPGTGDIQLSLIQKVVICGAVMVSTPQEVALADVRKSMGMFEKLSIPILGMVENMSMFQCPQCHTHTPIFKTGGTKTESILRQVALLGEIPLDPEITTCGDNGIPFVLQFPLNPASLEISKISKSLMTRIQ